MSQTQLQSLTAFFRENVPGRAQLSFDSVIDDMQVLPAAKDYGQGQCRMAVIRYNALLSWERFPYRVCAPQLLFALLEAWLDDHSDPVMDEVGITDADPDWDVSVESEETATIVLTMPLLEELVVVEDEKGEIPWQGTRWRLVEPEVWTALSGAVYGNDDAGAPVGEVS